MRLREVELPRLRRRRQFTGPKQQLLHGLPLGTTNACETMIQWGWGVVPGRSYKSIINGPVPGDWGYL